jgi:histidine triad (HIT) family protein
MTSHHCVFCKIISQEIPASFILENEFAVAFPDRSPLAPVHILVVPRRHIENLNAVTSSDSNMIAGMLALIQQLAQTHGNSSDHGFNIEINTGASAGQTVFHMHWHFKAGR